MLHAQLTNAGGRFADPKALCFWPRRPKLERQVKWMKKVMKDFSKAVEQNSARGHSPRRCLTGDANFGLTALCWQVFAHPIVARTQLNHSSLRLLKPLRRAHIRPRRI
jgi:hypothetical protein